MSIVDSPFPACVYEFEELIHQLCSNCQRKFVLHESGPKCGDMDCRNDNCWCHIMHHDLDVPTKDKED
jgi:hypothetical protein